MGTIRNENFIATGKRLRWGSICLAIAACLVTAALGCTQHLGFVDQDDCDDEVAPIRAKHKGDGPPDVRELAREVTALEDEIHTCGSITVKQPDVWGDANLMSYIQEYEQVMLSQLGNFQPTIQAYVARSDQAELQSVTSLGVALAPQGGAAGGGQTTVNVPSATKTSTPPTTPPTTPSSTPPSTPPTPPTLPTITKGYDQTTPTPQVFDVLAQALAPTAVSPAKTNFAIEPTESLRQNSTYLKVNQGLRRINTGDDSARAAGYGLYLFRVPVSVLPGRKTQQGYSAVVTMRAQMVVDPNHLHVTFPKLVLADMAETLLPIYEDNWDKKDLTTVLAEPKNISGGPQHSIGKATTLPIPNPLTVEQAKTLYGPEGINKLFQSAQSALKQKFPGKPPQDELRKFLFNYLLGTYKGLEEIGYLSGDHYAVIPLIGAAYARGEVNCLYQYRSVWEATISADPNFSRCNGQDKTQLDNYRYLGWMVAAQSAVMERQLKDALKDTLRAGHLPCAGGEAGIEAAQFANTSPPPDTLALWNEYVRAQYPLHIFELDPNGEEQNVYDAYSRRRELQLAIAFALANGNISASQAIQFTRQLALDMATIDLNRTHIAFAHGDDTFGWYFYPRVQTPPEESTNIGAAARLLWSTGPTREYDLRHRKLEPGMRECEVLVVMPNFVPEIKLDVTTNWEKLTKPGVSKLGYEDMIDLGTQVQKVRAVAAQVSGQGCSRPGDYERLVSRIEQLEKMLPMQTYSVNVPYQYDIPGRDLFDKGATTLAPEITSCYGIRFITRDVGSSTTTSTSQVEFFIAGHNFHPTQTHVIVGGTEVHTIPSQVAISTVASSTTVTNLNTAPVEVISRDLIKVKVPVVSSQWSTGPVPVRVATPSGLSNEFEIDAGAATPLAAYGFGLKTKALTIGYNWADAAKTQLKFTSTNPATFDLNWTNPTGSTLDEVTLNVYFAELGATPVSETFKLSDKDAPKTVAAKLGADCIGALNQMKLFSSDKPPPVTMTSTKIEVVPTQKDPLAAQKVIVTDQLTLTIQFEAYGFGLKTTALAVDYNWGKNNNMLTLGTTTPSTFALSWTGPTGSTFDDVTLNVYFAELGAKPVSATVKLSDKDAPTKAAAALVKSLSDALKPIYTDPTKPLPTLTSTNIEVVATPKDPKGAPTKLPVTDQSKLTFRFNPLK